MKTKSGSVSGQAVKWPAEDSVDGKIVLTDHRVRALDMKNLRRAKAIVFRPGNISTHAVYIAHQLGVPLAYHRIYRKVYNISSFLF